MPRFVYPFSTSGYVICFWVLPTVNAAAVNIRVHVFVGGMFSTLLHMHLGVQLLGRVQESMFE